MGSLLISKVGTGGIKKRRTNEGEIVDDRQSFIDEDINNEVAEQQELQEQQRIAQISKKKIYNQRSKKISYG